MNYVTFDYRSVSLIASLADSQLNRHVGRGFADSSSIAPSENGLVDDAETMWIWLVEQKKVPASRIVVAGQSLGTGVAAQLVARRLADKGTNSDFHRHVH